MGVTIKQIRIFAIVAVFAASLTLLLGVIHAQAQDKPDDGFSLQVTPSPLVATLKPGQDTTLELAIRNTGTGSQALKMGMSSFTIDEVTGQVNLGDTEPADVKNIVTFSQPTFNLAAGEIVTQKITIKTPPDAAFTYSFATTISRQNPVKPNGSSTAIEGSVAVFTLLGVDREGAERKFELSEFAVSKRVYEYLPADFIIKLKNTGNTLVQPKGNIYIQRGSNDQNPISVIQLNPNGGYILPNTNRILETSWNEGFPHYETVPDGDSGQTKRKLVWNWGDLSQIRIGKYTAKVIAVYDDGVRDVPVVSEVSFWVIPWRILIGFTLFLLLLVIGIVTTVRKSAKLIKKSKSKHAPPRE